MKRVKKVKPVRTTPEEKKKRWKIFSAVLALVLALELFHEAHPYFGIDGTPFFFAWFGFLACLGIIIVSKSLGFVLKRPEGYYRGDD